MLLPFSNDGSFLERFKQLSEKIVKQTEDQVKPIVPEPDAAAAVEPTPTAVGVSARYVFLPSVCVCVTVCHTITMMFHF